MSESELKEINFRMGPINEFHLLKLQIELQQCETPEEGYKKYNEIVDTINEETDRVHKEWLKISLYFWGGILLMFSIILITL